MSSRGFLLWIWCIFIFLLSAVSMEMCICLVGEAQKPTECVSTVNIDHNTIYWLRHNGQLAPEGSIAVETLFPFCTKQVYTVQNVLSAIQDLRSCIKIYV